MEVNILAKFFKLLSADASVDTLIPFVHVSSLEEFIKKYEDGILEVSEVRLLVHQTNFYCPELGSILLSSAISQSNQLPKPPIMELF